MRKTSNYVEKNGVAAAAFEEACWRRYCRERGVNPDAVRAGLETLDRNAATGLPHFPPVTTAYIAPALADAGGALYRVTEDMERWAAAGATERVGGVDHRISVTGAESRAAAQARPRWAAAIALKLAERAGRGAT